MTGIAVPETCSAYKKHNIIIQQTKKETTNVVINITVVSS